MQANVKIENQVVALLAADPICAALPVRLASGEDGILPIVRAFRVGNLEHSAIVCYAPRGDSSGDITNSGNKDWVLQVTVQTAFAEKSEPDAGQDSDSDGIADVPTAPLSPEDLEQRHSDRVIAVRNVLQVSGLSALLNEQPDFHVQHYLFDSEEHDVTESHLVSRYNFKLLHVAESDL